MFNSFFGNDFFELTLQVCTEEDVYVQRLGFASQNLLRLRRKTRFARLSPPVDSRAFGTRYSRFALVAYFSQTVLNWVFDKDYSHGLRCVVVGLLDTVLVSETSRPHRIQFPQLDRPIDINYNNNTYLTPAQRLINIIQAEIPFTNTTHELIGGRVFLSGRNQSTTCSTQQN